MTIIRITQHQQGIEDYLEHGLKKDRTAHRDELDVRVPLLGNLSVFQAANAFVKDHKKHWKDRYWHITISIPWQYHLIPTGVFREMTQNVLDFYFHLYDRQQLAAYAEIHYPKQQTVLNPVTMKHDQRLPHVHLIVSKLDLWAECQLRILPYKQEVAEAFQVWLDDVHQFDQPDYRIVAADRSHPLPTPEEAAAIIHDYQAWHQKYNQPDSDKQIYKPGFFLNQPTWQKERKVDKKRRNSLRAQLAVLTAEIMDSVHHADQYFLHPTFSVLSALQQRLHDENQLLVNEAMFSAFNQSIPITAVLDAACQFGLIRSEFRVVRRKVAEGWMEVAEDKRTSEMFSAVGIAHELLHLSAAETREWLTSVQQAFEASEIDEAEDINPARQESLDCLTKSLRGMS